MLSPSPPGDPSLEALRDRVIDNNSSPLITRNRPFGRLDLLTEILGLGYKKRDIYGNLEVVILKCQVVFHHLKLSIWFSYFAGLSRGKEEGKKEKE